MSRTLMLQGMRPCTKISHLRNSVKKITWSGKQPLRKERTSRRRLLSRLRRFTESAILWWCHNSQVVGYFSILPIHLSITGLARNRVAYFFTPKNRWRHLLINSTSSPSARCSPKSPLVTTCSRGQAFFIRPANLGLQAWYPSLSSTRKS